MLGIIIVTYKNPQRTADYINNQLTKLVNQYVVVVVNNSSTLHECEELANCCNGIACEPDDVVGKKPVYIVNSSENLGFAKGNNLGVRFLMRNNACEYILFSNDDILIEDGLDLRPMIDILERDKSIGAIGPGIIGIDGHHQSPHRRVITAYRQIGWILFSKLRKKSDTTSDKINIMPEEGPCYWVSGAFFLMRYGHFSAVNGFDPDTFLYSEEPILAERLKQLGKSMYFYPGLQVTHLEGGTTKNTLSNRRLSRMIVDSNCIYYKKYLKTPMVIILLYRLLSSIKH